MNSEEEEERYRSFAIWEIYSHVLKKGYDVAVDLIESDGTYVIRTYGKNEWGLYGRRRTFYFGPDRTYCI